MSKLDEIRRDLRTIHQHQSESAAEQMADTLVEHIEFLLTEVERLTKAVDTFSSARDTAKRGWQEAKDRNERVEELARRAGAGFTFPEEQIVTVSEILTALGGDE